MSENTNTTTLKPPTMFGQSYGVRWRVEPESFAFPASRSAYEAQGGEPKQTTVHLHCDGVYEGDVSAPVRFGPSSDEDCERWIWVDEADLVELPLAVREEVLKAISRCYEHAEANLMQDGWWFE